MKSIMTLALAALPCALFATTVVYTNAYTDTAQWGHEGNWTNSAGEVVALAPTNGEDIAFGPLESIATEWSRKKASVTNKIWPLVTVSTGLATKPATFVYPAVNPVVGTIGGEDTERYTIHPNLSRKYTFGQGKSAEGSTEGILNSNWEGKEK